MTEKFFGYIGDFKVRTSEIDAGKTLKITSFVQLMQECSMQNVIQLKLSVWDLEQDQLSWVLLKKDIVINRFPLVGEQIRIKTYPSGFHRIFAYRDFIVYDHEDNIIATASSTWGLMHTVKRRLIKIPSYEFYDHIPDHSLDRPSFSLSDNIDSKYSSETTIKWRQLDWNGHVNNVVLIEEMLDSLPVEFLNSRKLKQLQLQFKTESLLNDTLIAQSAIDHNHVQHIIRRKSDQAVIALAQSTWTN